MNTIRIKLVTVVTKKILAHPNDHEDIHNVLKSPESLQ